MAYKIIKLDEGNVRITVMYDTGDVLAIDIPISDKGEILTGDALNAYITQVKPPKNPDVNIKNTETILKNVDPTYFDNIRKAQMEEQAKIDFELAIKARDKKLKDSDWSQMPDVELTELEILVWKEYRQLLRDLPTQSDFPNNITYPIAPNEEAR